MRRRRRSRSYSRPKIQMRRQNKSSESLLSSLCPLTLTLSRWDHRRERYVKLLFDETMIDHFAMESVILEAECEDGIEQMTKHGVPQYHIGSHGSILYDQFFNCATDRDC